MPRSPSGASARPSPRVSIKSLELNALHTSQIQDMVHLNGNRSKRQQATSGSQVRWCPLGLTDFLYQRDGEIIAFARPDLAVSGTGSSSVAPAVDSRAMSAA